MENMPMPVPICSLKDAISAPIRTILCSVRDNRSNRCKHCKGTKKPTYHGRCHSLLRSSHGLKKPLMLANKDAIPSTVMPMM
jgi:hypothetical protein